MRRDSFAAFVYCLQAMRPIDAEDLYSEKFKD